jgi:SAM-dependent methyltransferase
MSVFNEYARYYDLLYRDKDYQAEAEYVHRLIQRTRPGAETLLNLGCGSGRHDRYLAEFGYSVTGIDMSEEMLASARNAAEANGAVEYRLGDIRSFRCEQQFDAVISLFHVMSYQVSNKDLVDAFTTAHFHLKTDGAFLFDCWYGPGVLTDRPAVKVKDLEDDRIKITRIAKPVMKANQNTVEVHYQLFIQDKMTKKTDEILETHRMRYLFEPEIQEFLSQAGLIIVSSEEWLTAGSLDFTSWNAVFICSKDGSQCH